MSATQAQRNDMDAMTRAFLVRGGQISRVSAGKGINLSSRQWLEVERGNTSADLILTSREARAAARKAGK